MSFALLKTASRLVVLALAVQSQAGQACEMPPPELPSLSASLGDPRQTVFVGTVIRTLHGVPDHSSAPGGSLMRVDEWYGAGAGSKEIIVAHDPPLPCGQSPYFVARTGEQWVIVGRYRGTVLKPDARLSEETGGKGHRHRYSHELEALRLSRKNRR